jgi:hypothetical protein
MTTAVAVWHVEQARFSWIAKSDAALSKLDESSLLKVRTADAALRSVVSLKAAGRRARRYTLEPFVMHDGATGLMVYEGAYCVQGAAPAPKQARAARHPAARNTHVPTPLTHDEFKALTAIARKVKRLCKRPQRDASQTVPAAPPPRPKPAALDLTCAFDTFLLFDRDWRLVRVKRAAEPFSRAQLARGLSLPDLLGVGWHVALPYLQAAAGKATRKDMTATPKGFGTVRCRLVAGPWADRGAAYFAGIICLGAQMSLRPLSAAPVPARLPLAA